jgi:hypothetical protein
MTMYETDYNVPNKTNIPTGEKLMTTRTNLNAFTGGSGLFSIAILMGLCVSCMPMPVDDGSGAVDQNDNSATAIDNQNDNGSGSGGALDNAVFEFETENGTAVMVTQGDELEAVFETETDKSGGEESVRRLRVASAASNVEADFDDAGRVSNVEIDGATIDVTYGDNNRFDYVIKSGGMVVVEGTATLQVFNKSKVDDSSTTAAAIRGQILSTAGNDNGETREEPSLKKVVAACSMSLGSSIGENAVRDCSTSLPGPIENCYVVCLQRNEQYNSMMATLCTFVQILGRVQGEEKESCLARMDRPAACCQRLASTADSITTYLNFLWSTAEDMAAGLRTMDSCPYSDLSQDSQCGGVSFNIIENCPTLADDDGNEDDMDGKDMDGDDMDGDDMDGDKDPVDDGDPKKKEEPIVCDENSVPPDPNCFAVINITDQGTPSASSVFDNNKSEYGAFRATDTNIVSSWFSDGNPDGKNDAEAYTWTFDENVDIFLARVETDPEQFNGGGLFGFATVAVRVLDASGAEVYNSGFMTMDGFRVDFTEAFPAGLVGRSVQLLLVGHQDKSCGGFAELRVYGFELIQPEPEPKK